MDTVKSVFDRVNPFMTGNRLLCGRFFLDAKHITMCGTVIPRIYFFKIVLVNYQSNASN